MSIAFFELILVVVFGMDKIDKVSSKRFDVFLFRFVTTVFHVDDHVNSF